MADGQDQGGGLQDLLGLGLLGSMGIRGLGAAAKGFRAVAPYIANGALGAAAEGAGAGYALYNEPYSDADTTPQYVRDADGHMIPNPKANHALFNPEESGAQMFDTAGFLGTGIGENAPASGGAAAPSPSTPEYDGDYGWGNSDPFATGTDADYEIAARSKPAGQSQPPRDERGRFTSAPPQSMWGRFGSVLHDNSNMFLGLGAGFAGKGSFGEAMSGGFSGATKGSALDVAQNMQVQGIRAAYQNLIEQGVSPSTALAAVYNPELYKRLIAETHPEPKVVNWGHDQYGQPGQALQIGPHIVPGAAAVAPSQVRTFEEALRLPKGVLFSLPDGRVFQR